MKLTALAIAALVAATPAAAQDADPYNLVSRLAYSLFGPSYRGAVIESGARTDRPVLADREHRRERFGQDLGNARHSRDRGGMQIELKDKRSSEVAQGGIGGFIATIRDLGDQGRRSPASIELVDKNGNVLDSIAIRGGSTKAWNGNVRTVTYAGWIPGGSSLRINAGQGRVFDDGRPDRGARGFGDGFSVKVRTRPDCPPGDDDRMHMTTKRQTVASAQKPQREAKAGKSKDRGSKSDRGGKGKRK